MTAATTGRLLVLTKRVPWYGGATGYYAMLPRALAEAGVQVDVVAPRPGNAVRVLGKLWSLWHGLDARHQSEAFAEWEFVRRFRRGGGPGLVLALEDHLPMISLRRFAGGAPRELVGVIHFPFELWTQNMLAMLGRLRSALVLYRSDIPQFERHVGKGRVAFVPHGVDTRHFTPGPRAAGAAPRLLVTGQFRRDFELLAEVFSKVRGAVPRCTLDVVGAHHVRDTPPLRRLAAMEGVTVHGFRSDAELLEHYRAAAAMLLPLQAAGANNSLVEALACGTPVVATDRGGVRDYGGGEIFPVVPPGDGAAFAAAVTELLRSPVRAQAVAAAGRRFAEEELSWERSVTQHREALEKLCTTGAEA